MTRSPVKQSFLVILAIVGLVGFDVCFAGNPTLFVSQSNNNIVISWPAETSTNLVLMETTGFNRYYFSNDVIYAEIYPRKINSRSNYTTNASSIVVTLPIDSTNKIYFLGTNDFFPPLHLKQKP